MPVGTTEMVVSPLSAPVTANTSALPETWIVEPAVNAAALADSVPLERPPFAPGLIVPPEATVTPPRLVTPNVPARVPPLFTLTVAADKVPVPPKLPPFTLRVPTMVLSPVGTLNSPAPVLVMTPPGTVPASRAEAEFTL